MLELLGIRGNTAGPARKVLIVCAGYVLAVLAGMVASWLYNLRVSHLPYDTSGGMYAFGVLLQGTAAFLGVALIPTLLALWYLRTHWRFWQVIAPTRPARRLLTVAVGLELVVGVCAAIHWFLPRPPF